MADIKISQLPAATAALGTQEFEVNESGTSKKVTGSQIEAFVKGSLVTSDITDLTATATELNLLDGVTATTTEINQLDGNVFTGNFSVDTNTLFVDSTNDEVGIGTSSPNAKLHVAGSVIIENANATNELTFSGSEYTNIYSDSTSGFDIGTTSTGGSSVLRFLTENTEQARIASNGNFGIATNSPAETLDVRGTIRLTNTINGSNFGTLLDGGGLVVSSGNNNPMYFYTGGSERMRIDASGNVGIGTTATSLGRETISFDNGGQSGTRYIHASTTYNGEALVFLQANNSTKMGSVYCDGAATSYNTSSDYRLKEDVQPMAGAADRLMSLKPVNFAWKVNGNRVDGFLAHEAQEVVPEAVTGQKDQTEIVEIKDEDGNVTGTEERPVYQGIDQSKLVPLLTAALQEAFKKIEVLEARLTILENK